MKPAVGREALSSKIFRDGGASLRDIRAKARSDDDKKLLSHANPEGMAKIYQRESIKVQLAK